MRKYEAVKKYWINNKISTINNVSAMNAPALICGKRRIGELHGAFLLVRFDSSITGDLRLCVVWSKTNINSEAKVLNLNECTFHKINIKEKLENKDLLIP